MSFAKSTCAVNRPITWQKSNKNRIRERERKRKREGVQDRIPEDRIPEDREVAEVRSFFEANGSDKDIDINHRWNKVAGPN